MTNPPRFCAKCGATLRPGGRFCAVCGSPVAARPPAAAAPKPAPAESPVAPTEPAAVPGAAAPPSPAPSESPPSAPEAPWPTLPPEPEPFPPFGPETLGAPVQASAPLPPATKGRSKAPCMVIGCLGAVVVLALGCWALYTALASAAQQYTDVFGKISASLATPTRQAEVTAPPAVTATATRPPGTPTPAPPTATAAPTATPAPVQVYTADFSGAAPDWSLTTEANLRNYLQDSAFHAVYTTTAAYGTAWKVPKSFPVFRDFTLEMKGRYESGPQGNGYGVVFRYADSSNFYFFIVTPDGKWGLGRYLKGALSGLVLLTADSAILKGKTPNTLRVVARGPNFTFSVNGKQVGTFTDSSHSAGTVGVFMSNETAGAHHAVYESLKATILLP
jgi:hypothetical protein